jgi:hypothetical protein
LAGGIATFTTSGLGGGSHSITATYSGEAGFASSGSVALTQTVDPAGTTAALSSSSNPANADQSIDFAITISSTAGEPGGTVTLMDGDNSVTIADLVKGEVTVAAVLTGGTHELTVAYSGDADFAASVSAALSQVVTPGVAPDAAPTLPSDAGAAPDARPPADAGIQRDAATTTADAGATANPDAAANQPDAASATPSSGGCSCETGRSSSGSPFWLLLLGLGLLRRAGAARRARGRRPATIE